MRSTSLVSTALGSVAALVGLASAAGASATVDLIWLDTTDPACLDAGRRDCPQLGPEISSVATSDDVTLGVILTAGPRGVLSAGVSVDYRNVVNLLSVTGFRSLITRPFFAYRPGDTSDIPPFIDIISAAAMPAAGFGIGLPAGASAYLGTVMFHTEYYFCCGRNITVGANGPSQVDGVLDLDGELITATTTFNGAFLIGFGDPSSCDDAGAPMVIEVNTLRAGGSKVRAGPDQTVDVTAKARILKGTARIDTTLDMTLTIEAVDGTAVIGSNSTGPITLEVGKGGTGAKLAVGIPQCNSGFIRFVARFSGQDADGDACSGARELRTECK